MQRANIVVVGGGNWGKNLIRNFNDLGVLKGIVELDPQLRSQLACQYPHVPIYEHYAEALALDDVAIVLATPAPSHYALALEALKAGKDLFIEKPMTLKKSEAEELALYADQHQQILMVGHLLLYQPAITWMRNYLYSGQGGQVYHVATQRLNLGTVRRTENVWWSFSPHDVAILLDLLGNPQLKSVEAVGYCRLQSQIEDEIQVNLTFNSGQTAHLHCSWQWPQKQRGTIVLTDRQMLVYDEIAQSLTLHHKSIDASLKVQDQGVEVIPVASDQPLQLECQHFLDCLKTRQRPHSDGWNGVRVVEILERVQTVLSTES